MQVYGFHQHEQTWGAGATNEGKWDEAAEVVAEDKSEAAEGQKEEADHGQVTPAEFVRQDAHDERSNLKKLRMRKNWTESNARVDPKKLLIIVLSNKVTTLVFSAVIFYAGISDFRLI